MAVALLPVTHENVDAVCELAVHEHQRRFVAPAAKTVAEAKCHEPGAFLRAITVDGRPVGVVWVQTDEPVPYLVRFMIDAAWQARGIGRRAVGLLLDELRTAGHTELEAIAAAAFCAQKIGGSPRRRSVLADGAPTGSRCRDAVGRAQPLTAASLNPGRFSLDVQPGAPSSRSASSTIRPSGPRT